ncbi:hypothetical protein L798_07088 [Zootermopsis nevadensis]|uniref:Uncharacterized protein n=1 Tax=Zootermopsis nevadensis TaxID=136037 RepID=A0A067RTM2_ZOONE|nr:hypothetical protein L798_07088 [Zootermopsis nevadensis]
MILDIITRNLKKIRTLSGTISQLRTNAMLALLIGNEKVPRWGKGVGRHLTSLETCSADRLRPPGPSPPALFRVPTLILIFSLFRGRRLEARIQRGAGRRDKNLGPSHK